MVFMVIKMTEMIGEKAVVMRMIMMIMMVKMLRMIRIITKEKNKTRKKTRVMIAQREIAKCY